MPEDNPGAATLEAVLAEKNLRAAWLAVKANDGAPGVDKMHMEQSARHLREHWGRIREKLLNGDYKPGAVRAVKIPKANGGERQLGFRIDEEGRIGVSPKAIGKLKDRVRQMWDARQSLTSKQMRDQWQRYIRGWWNYFQLADWRRSTSDFGLKRLGVRGRALGLGYTRRGAWATARTPALQQALRNRTLARYGFIIPWEVAAKSEATR